MEQGNKENVRERGALFESLPKMSTIFQQQEKFVEEMQVLENQRLPAGQWVQSFCKVYGSKDHRHHGEAGSVDLEAVKWEHAHVSALCEKYHLRDILNFDETAFFPL